MMRRRTVIQVVMGALTARPWASTPLAQSAFGPPHRPRVLTLAAVVLPGELGAEGQGRAVDQFMRWVADYRAGAEMDHGYGHTRPRVTPASPEVKYVEHLDDLDRRAGGTLATRAPADQRRIVTEAIDAAQVRTLPGRPNGGHLATDLMAHYFGSAAANDFAYGRVIGRDACRDLTGSEARPAALTSGGR